MVSVRNLRSLLYRPSKDLKEKHIGLQLRPFLSLGFCGSPHFFVFWRGFRTKKICSLVLSSFDRSCFCKFVFGGMRSVYGTFFLYCTESFQTHLSVLKVELSRCCPTGRKRVGSTHRSLFRCNPRT